jgi:hypothetical protein
MLIKESTNVVRIEAVSSGRDRPAANLRQEQACPAEETTTTALTGAIGRRESS